MRLSGDIRHVLVRVDLLSVIQVEWDAAFLQAAKVPLSEARRSVTRYN